MHPEKEFRVFGAIGEPSHLIGSSHVRVHRAHAGRCALGGGAVAVRDCEDVTGRGGKAPERIALPVAVLRNAGHGQWVERLDHQRTDCRERKAAVAVDPPDDALRSEQPPVFRMLCDGALVGPRERLHHPDLRRGLGAHVATIPA